MLYFKYRDWENKNHQKIITENSIYMASPRNFEDEKDCNLPEIFPSIVELLNFLWTNSFSHSQYCILSSEDRHKNIIDWVRESPAFDPYGKGKVLSDEFKQEYYDRFGVLSLTKRSNNTKMWEKYGADHKGFCVGLDNALLELVVGGAGEVQYYEKLPAIKLLVDNTLTEHVKQVYSKTTEWSFEEEYRCHKMWNHKATTEERNIKLLPFTIKEVIIGESMNEKDMLDIISKVKQYQPQAKITIEGES